MAHVTDKLAGYLEGGLPEEMRESVEGHLAACPRCRAALVEMRSAGRALSEAGRSVPLPAQDGGLWSRVRAEITPAPPRRYAPRWAMAGGVALAAVALAAMVKFQPAPAPVTADNPRMVAKAPVGATPEPAAPITAPSERAYSTPGIIEGRPRTIVPDDLKAFNPPPPAPAAEAPRAALREAPEKPAAPKPEETRGGAAPAVAADEPLSPLADAIPAPVGSTAAVARRPVGRTAQPPPAAAPAPGVELKAASRDRQVLAPQMRPSAPTTSAPEPLAPEGIAQVYTYADTAVPAQAAPGEATRLFARAQSERALGKSADARQGYEAALKAGLPPTQARLAHVILGDMAVSKKDDADARDHYTAALTIAKDASLLTRLGAVYERLKEPERAADAYRQALEIAPNDADARAGLERVKASGP